MIHVKRLHQTILKIVQNDLQHCLFGYTVVLTSAKKNFQIWMWINSVLYSLFFMNDGRSCDIYCNFFFSCFSVTSNSASLGFTVILYKKSKLKQWQIMLRLRLAKCPRLKIFSHRTKMWWADGHRRKAKTPVQRIARLLRDKIELYQEVDLTRAKILINIINDVVAVRFWIIEQKYDLQRNSVPEKRKTRISHVKPKEPFKILDVF